MEGYRPVIASASSLWKGGRTTGPPSAMWYNVGMAASSDRKRTIPKRTTVNLDASVDEYLMNRSLRERSSYWEDKHKARLMEYLATEGEVQVGGHRTYTFDHPRPYVAYSKSTGMPQQKVVKGIERKRREGTALNEQRTMALLKELGLLDKCTEVVLVLNEDAVLAANYEGLITDEQLKAAYDTTESFAFYLTTEDA
jgi:hypothetical protein